MMRFAPHRTWRVAAAAALLLCGGALWAETLSPEEKLAAIRKGLVQAALDGPTQVSATQWIDGNGALQELSAFRSGMKVRGVRVLAYGADAQGEPTAKLQWQSADGTDATGSGKAPACKTPLSGRLQHVLGWNWTSQTAWGADYAPVLDALQATVLAQLQQAGASSAQWRLVERARNEGRTSYQQALLGSSQDEMPWQLQFQLLSISPSRSPSIGTIFSLKGLDTSLAPQTKGGRSEQVAEPQADANANAQGAGLQVQVRMTLTARKQAKPMLQSSASLTLPATDDNWASPGLSPAAQAQVEQQVQAWSQALQTQLRCQAVMADVTQAAAAQVRINVGSAAGVRVGDEWVLAHDQNGVQRALEPGAAAQTVLAKVQAVGEYYAQLRPLNDTKQTIQTTWTAWSAEAQR